MIVGAVLVFSFPCSQASDLADWDYKQLINISNTAGNLSYYQARIDLNSSNVGANWNWIQKHVSESQDWHDMMAMGEDD